uniref:Uncharacterized protein n=1 Tax=Timema cristinae TaxID=61476 RepID=A0A7R9DCH8_TIMCR|nr:unnamed protein product [Timema cristinae]
MLGNYLIYSALTDRIVSMLDIIPHSYTYVAMELRKCILHHDWKNATRLVLMLLNGSKALEPLMWKMCVLVLFNHPMATKQLREDFVRYGAQLVDRFCPSGTALISLACDVFLPCGSRVSPSLLFTTQLLV